MIFYVYNSKIHIVFAFPFIFRFLVLIVTSSHPVTDSLFFSQHNGVVSLSPLLIFFWGFLIAHECDHSLIAAYTQTTFLSDHIVDIFPPSEACSCNPCL